MPSAYNAVAVDDLWIKYRTSFEKAPTLKGALHRFARRQKSTITIEALKGISFKVPNGSVLGIVGANGAGKTTLVRAIAGILPPEQGRIRVRGDVTTMLASGVGFNPQLSGRENIRIGALAKGLTEEEIRDCYDEIVEFSELGEFIDLPVKTYSSGMRGRLGFSVAVHAKPEILLIDEGLSAGDASFKEKARAKMESLLDQASSILIVSHGLGIINQLADRALWLHKGQQMALGPATDVTEQYADFAKVKRDSAAMNEDF